MSGKRWGKVNLGESGENGYKLRRGKEKESVA